MTTIARTILEQLGGSKFVAMTGAKNLLADATGLRFRLPSGAKNGATNVHIDLDLRTDTYTVTFHRVRGTSCVQLSETPLVYAEDLRQVFTTETGLETSLGTMSAPA